VSGAFLRLLEVTKRFDKRSVIERVSLELREGQAMALLGPSGCGKTTLLRLIAGLETPDDGEIWIAGQKVAAKGRNTVPPRGRNIGFVFQDLALWPHLTVAGNLDFVLQSQRWERRTRRDRIDEVLRMVHMAAHTDKYPSQLSGGEQQRVAIARAIVARSQLLLLDEPLSNLDTDLKATLLHELCDLQQQLEITMLYVTHDRDEAGTFAHQVALMHSGRINQILSADLFRGQSKAKMTDLADAVR
jgi:ABC-type sugar transport system ATPase subunit